MNLWQLLNEITKPQPPFNNISNSHYEKWVKTATWDRLKNQTVGQSFCKFFKVNDYFLLHTRDQYQHWRHIKEYYCKHTWKKTP